MDDEKLLFSVPLESVYELLDECKKQLLVAEDYLYILLEGEASSNLAKEYMTSLFCEMYCSNFRICDEIESTLQDGEIVDSEERSQLVFMKDTISFLERALTGRYYLNDELNRYSISTSLH